MNEITQPLDPPLATGRTAEIYAWPDGRVLKLYHAWFGLSSIEYEARVARAIHACGMPVPAVGEILRVNGRIGLVYQRVDGDSMWQKMRRKPWRTFAYARRMAELHAGMHTVGCVAGILPQRQRLVRKIEGARALPARLRSRALAALEALPDGDRLCHGDFHPGNILMPARDMVIIDWIDATCGNPLADLARTIILGLGVVETRQVPDLSLKLILRMLLNEYQQHYFRLRPGGEQEYRRWLPIVAAARLEEEIPELEQWLLEKADRGL